MFESAGKASPYPMGTYMIPWWTSVDIVLITVDSFKPRISFVRTRKTQQTHLSTTGKSRAHKYTSVFSNECASRPKPSSRVPECLELGGEVAVTGGNAKEECVKLF
jgi:hypothetical protein